MPRRRHADADQQSRRNDSERHAQRSVNELRGEADGNEWEDIDNCDGGDRARHFPCCAEARPPANHVLISISLVLHETIGEFEYYLALRMPPSPKPLLLRAKCPARARRSALSASRKPADGACGLVVAIATLPVEIHACARDQGDRPLKPSHDLPEGNAAGWRLSLTRLSALERSGPGRALFRSSMISSRNFRGILLRLRYALELNRASIPFFD